MTKLVEVRCPINKWIGSQQNKSTCNQKCGEIGVGGYGKLHCRKCKASFEFMVRADDEVKFFNIPEVKQKVPKKILEKMSPEDRLLLLVNE